MATKGKDNLQIKPQQSSREAKQLSKFRLIGKDDNASTTGLLVNPPAAVIPNPTGAGGQAGGMGLFGATLGAGTPEDRGGYRGGRGNQNPPVENPFMTLFNIYTNPDTYSLRGPIQTGNSRRDKGGNVNPSLVPLSNGFAGMGTGAGTQTGIGSSLSPDKQGNPLNPTAQVYGAVNTYFGNIFSGNQQTYPLYANSVQAQQSPVYPLYANSVQAQQNAAQNNATQAYIQGEKGYVPITAPILARLEKERQAATTSNFNSPYYGTAGMYTYGAFSDKDAAFSELLARGVPTNIPTYMADSMGLTESLQDPASGWKLIDGNWVNQNPTGIEEAQLNNDYMANSTPFEEQLRWDPASGTYITIAEWLRDNGDPRGYRGNREAKQRQKEREARKIGWNEQTDGTLPPVDTVQPEVTSGFTGSWGVVSFNTGSG